MSYNFDAGNKHYVSETSNIFMAIHHGKDYAGTLHNLLYQDDYSSTEEQSPLVHPSYMQPLMQLLASLDTNTMVDLARPHFRKIFRSEE